jgi:hypothetical protein
LIIPVERFNLFDDIFHPEIPLAAVGANVLNRDIQPRARRRKKLLHPYLRRMS